MDKQNYCITLIITQWNMYYQYKYTAIIIFHIIATFNISHTLVSLTEQIKMCVPVLRVTVLENVKLLSFPPPPKKVYKVMPV